MNLPHFQAIY